MRPTRWTATPETTRSTGGSLRRNGGRPPSGTALRPRNSRPVSRSIELLAEEEPDVTGEVDDEPIGDLTEDEDAADEDVDGLLLDDGPDPRAGRLVAEDEGAHPDEEADLVARDTGIDGGAATAEEAAMHVVEDDDTDIRSDG